MRYFIVTFLIVSIATHAAFAQTSSRKAEIIQSLEVKQSEILSGLVELEALKADLLMAKRKKRDAQAKLVLEVSQGLIVATMGIIGTTVSRSQHAKYIYSLIAIAATGITGVNSLDSISEIKLSAEEVQILEDEIDKLAEELREEAVINSRIMNSLRSR
jgi:antirestriction protein ArdC